MNSVWTEKVNNDCPLPEYPRPQFERSIWQNLNGTFDFHIATRGEKWISEYTEKIIVPFAIESKLSGVEKPLRPTDRLWYQKKFILNDELKNKEVFINFGAVDWQCKVYINKELVGTHTGGYCNFSFDITSFLIDGENTLNVCVYDPTESGWQQRGKQDNNPHGFWYTATSGIWQTVWLEAVDSLHIENIKLLPDIDAGTINIKTSVSSSDYTALSLTLTDGENEVLKKDISTDETIKIENAKLWSPESPNLYDIKLEVLKDGVITDTVKSYFGMRKFNIAKDKFGVIRLFLNNEPYFQRGLLDQGYWPDGGMTPPTDEAMIFDISEMKRLGFNMLRKHIKIEPMRWYYHCDRLGMLVWQDMMSGGAYIGDFYAGFLPNIGIKHVKDDKYDKFSRSDKKWRDDYKRELTEMIDQLQNCTSIYCWVPFNEAWGQFDALKICKYVKSLDQSRVVDHASGWYDQGGGDFISMHKYILPIIMPKLDGKRAFVISEFGGYSRKITDHMWNGKKAFGYLMFKDKENLTAAYKKLYEKQVIPLIDKGLSATVYTQVSDVENEVNGIYTYDRTHLKIEESVIKDINNKLKI